jgi:ABC-type polysaccharide/polyol phosphate transport system, ATPase component
VDEALSVGDVFFVQKCMNFMRSFMEKNTVIFVSHDIAAVKALCDRVVFLESGKVRMISPPAEAAEAYIEAMYQAQGADTETVKHAGREAKTESGAKAESSVPDEPECRDMRRDFINGTSLRNDIEVFAFNREASAFGNDGAQIDSVCLTDLEGVALSWVVGGEDVRLTVTGRAQQTLHSPIVGFFLKDRLGQELFGDNTYLAYQGGQGGQDRMPHVPSGAVLKTHFTFRMPILPPGEYVFAVALAEGTQARHTQLCWMHNALVLHSHSTSCTTGLIGIPMRDIRMEVVHR